MHFTAFQVAEPKQPRYSYYLLQGKPATKTKQSPVAQLAEHSTVNRRVTGSSPVGGAYKTRTLETSSRGFLLYLFLWLEPVTTPPYVSAGALPSGSVWLIPFGGKAEKASERSSEAFPFSRRDSNAVTTALGAGAGALPPGPRAYALGEAKKSHHAKL